MARSERQTGIESFRASVRCAVVARSVAVRALLVFTALLGSTASCADTAVRREPLGQYAHRCFGVTDGLPHGSVTDLALAPDGRMVVATYGGVVLFDGARFSSIIPGSTHRFPPLEAAAVAVDDAGVIWVGTTTEGVYRFEHDDVRQWRWGDDEVPVGNDIFRLEPGAEHVLVVNNRRPVLLPRSGQGQVLVGDQAISLTRFSGAWRDASGVFHIGNGRQVWRHAGGTHWEQLALANEAAFGGGLNAVILGKDGSFIGAHSTGLVEVDGNRVRPLDLGAPVELGVVRDMALGPRGDIWLSASGVGVMRTAEGQLESYPDLPSRHAVALAFDREGHLWVGTATGLCNLRSRPIKTLTRSQGLAAEFVEFVVRDAQDRVYAMTYDDSLAIARIENDRIGQVDIENDVPPGARRINAIAFQAGTTWVATDTQVGRLADAGWERAFDLPSRPRVLLADDDDGLWIGTTESGVLRWRRGELSVVPGLADDGNRVIGMTRTHAGDVLAAKYSGVFRIRNGRSVLLDELTGEATCVAEFRPGEIWVCGVGLRLAVDGRVHHFDSSDGLAFGHTHAVVEDDFGSLWVTTNAGLFRATRAAIEATLAGNRPPRLFQRFDERDGMWSSEFNGGPSGAAKTADGRLWFAGQGVTVVDPASLNSAPPPLRPFIDELAVDGADLPAWPAIEPNPARIRIHFGAVLLSDAQSLAFRYRLLPVQQTWETTTQRSVDYSYLPAGEHRFEVAVRHRNGDWTGAVARTLRITPAWYETLWLRGGMLALLLFLGVAIPVLRIRSLRAREQALETLVGERTADLERANRRLDAAARTDALTDLANRRELAERLADACDDDSVEVHLALIDIDDFKAYNDRFGHLAGDQCLVSVAATLGEAAGSAHRIARFGGEEFAIVWTGQPPATVHHEIARVHDLLRDRAIAHPDSQPSGRVTVSIGLAARAGGDDLDRLIDRADRALYRAKAEGKDGTRVAPMPG